MSQDEGGINDLFDLTFTKFITPTVIRIVYILVIIFAAIGWLVAVISGFVASVQAGIGALIFATLGALIALLMWRVLLELTMVIFKIKDNTDPANN
jgi:hypothetical protein